MIVSIFEYAGTKAQAEPLYAPFLTLNPVVATNVTVPYTGVAHASGAGVEDPVCAKGLSWKLFPVGLQVYNIATNRAIYNIYSKMGTRCKQSRPSILRALLMHIVRIICLCMFLHHLPSQSFLLLSYYRVFLTLNSSFAPVYPANHTLDAIADTYGKQARGVLHAGDAPGRPLNTYVNYASTDETPEQMYGYEPWRLAKLRALKEKYDPKGRFNFYAPVNP